ncbi:BTAD domain-containing putative transcriptional regulator [Actinoplanes sp. NPDC051851]|uniref:AfsR/SARP family transcriptional regulator n=1 Tax=Actinoplanes sp. NPDC051851 TaxID=3154753 RepID=UPI003419C07A
MRDGVPPIRLEVLGALRVLRAGAEVEPGGVRPQRMLALLLTRAGGTVSPADLIALLWPAEPPANATNMVHRYVGMIRRAFEPGLPVRAEGGWLAGTAEGYRLRADRSSADVLEFRELVATASAAEPAEAVPIWTAALSLWRGPYAQGLGAVAAFAAVDRERTAAALAAGAAARRAGVPGRMLPLVRAAAEADPLDEALAAEMMRLLAQDGRPEEAAAWYRRIEEELGARLGLVPGAALAEVLEQVTRPARPARPAALPHPAQLPPDLRLFSGRSGELRALSEAAEGFTGPGLIAIDGIPGVGKSTLAVHWAHRVAHRFPDGQLFANLRGFDPAGVPVAPGEVLGGFLEALGVSRGGMPEDPDARAGLYRTLTVNRRLLVVLDNVRTVEQVRPLILAAPGSLVLVTSRLRLDGLAVREGAALISLDLPSPREARDALRRRVRDGRIPDGELDRVVELCGRLPLALSIVAARGIGDLLTDLDQARASLDPFDDEAPGGVREVFSWSYRQLSPGAARLFRLLPAHTGPDAGLPLLVSLAGRPARDTARLLRELVRARLVDEARPGRYAQHDLIAVYATETAAEHETADERERAADRLLDHFTRTVELMNERNIRPVLRVIDGVTMPGVEPELFGTVPDALAWFLTERENLLAALRSAYRRGRHPWRTVIDLFNAYLRTGRIPMWAEAGGPALEAAVAAGDLLAEAHLRRLLGNVYALTDRERGTAEYERSLSLFEDFGAPAEQASVLVKIAETWSLNDVPDFARALPFYERAVSLYRSSGNTQGLGHTLTWLGRTLLELGRAEEGTATLTEALLAVEFEQDINLVATIFLQLGMASGRPDATDFLVAANRMFREVSSRIWALLTDLMVGEAYLRAGRRLDAAAVWERSVVAFDALAAESAFMSPDLRSRMARLDAEFAPGR